MKPNCVRCTSFEEVYIGVQYTVQPFNIKAYKCRDCGLIITKAEDIKNEQ